MLLPHGGVLRQSATCPEPVGARPIGQSHASNIEANGAVCRSACPSVPCGRCRLRLLSELAIAEIRTPCTPPGAVELQRSHQIVVYTHDTARSLLAGFNSLGQARGRGAPSDEQQDLLRAMLLFAGAGLDACAQQIVRDALQRLVSDHDDAREAFTNFAAKRLRRQSETDVAGIDARFLAELLLGDPEKNLVEALIDDLTGSSMQSVEELKRVAAHLGLTSDSELLKAIEGVRGAFKVRNRIAHDMDINFFDSKRRNRTVRKRADMVREANNLLAAAEGLVLAVDRIL